MNLLKLCLWSSCGSAALSLSALAAPVNGGFESADYSSWQATIPSDYSEFDVAPRLAGSATVVSSWQRNDMLEPKIAAEGNYFLALGSHDAAYYTNTLTYDIFVSQTFSLQTGQSLAGLASFYNGDAAPQDSAWVRILDAPGENLLATPWQEFSGAFPDHPDNLNVTAYRLASAWTAWEWTAPLAGDYTLAFGVTTQGDNRFGSFGFFDGTGVFTAVPEPSVVSLAAISAAGLFLARRRRNF